MFLKTIKQVKLPKQMVHRKTYFFIDYQNKTRKEYNLAEGRTRAMKILFTFTIFKGVKGRTRADLFCMPNV
jgi:hypothetical protein